MVVVISDLVLTIQAVYGAPEELHAVITPAAVTVSMTSLTSRPRTTISQTLQGADAAEWHNRLAKLGIAKWEDHYAPAADAVILAGTKWQLVITQTNGETRTMTGDNAFPPGWEKLITLLRQSALAVNGHIVQPIRWQFDYVRFADLRFPQFHGPTDALHHVAIFQRTLAIDPGQGAVVVHTTFSDNRRNHTEQYTDPALTQWLVLRIGEALAELGDLQTMKLDTLDYPDAIFGVILTYPGDEQIVVQVDADDPDMRDFWRVLNQLLTQGLNLANQSAAAEWRKLGPVLEYFVAVTFDDGGKAYYYRSDLTDLAIDDRVIVPVGQSNHLLTGTIVDITTDLPANLPIPPEDIKSVIRKKEVL